MDDCVGKPFTSQELWHCLMKYLKPLDWQRVDENQHAMAEDKLRQKLINNFVKDNSNKYGEIAEAIKKGDIKLAHRLAHTLKSNAGQLEKDLLRQAAADIENQLKDGQNLVTAEQMMALEKELNAALAELEPQVVDLSGGGTAAGAEQISVESALELIGKLEPLLELGDIGARQYVYELRHIKGGEDLIRQIEDFDFDLALATLAELKKSLEKPRE
jgi:HPt (histidine-containing phosphotransfer) domain-containing protein